MHWILIIVLYSNASAAVPPSISYFPETFTQQGSCLTTGVYMQDKWPHFHDGIQTFCVPVK